MGTRVDRAFIRRAVEACDLEALRAALFQASADPELARFAPVAVLAPEERAKLEAKVAEMLEFDLDSLTPRVPSDEEVRRVMDIVLGGPTRDEHFVVRRKMLAFENFPFCYQHGNNALRIPKDFRVAIIGAGPAGLAMAIQLEHLRVPYTIYERRHEVGGTWSRNTYPDIRVDTLSITYELTLDEQYPWSEYFARGAEVRDYLEHVARKHGVFERIRFNHALETANFDDQRSQWELTFATPDGRGATIEANVVISAAGLFATPRTPDLEGIDGFEGRILEPTEWPKDFDASGQRIGVLGNGSTGVQLLAPLARKAEHITVFQRTAQWISPRPRYGDAVEPEVRWLFDHVPGYWNWCRYTSMINLFDWHEDFLVPDEEWQRHGGRITQKSDELRGFLTSYIKEQVGDRPDLIEKLIPDYPPMLRRPVVDNGWYAALTRDNVDLVTDPIVRATRSGLETADGQTREFDAIVLATGYDLATYLWPTRYQGSRGADLQAFWEKESPRAYLGMLVPEFPNFFMLYGPNSQPVSGGISLPSWFQIWAAYIAQCLAALFEGGHRSVAVTREAYEDYNRRLDEEASGMAFETDTASAEKNYYVNASGRLQANTPFETADLYAMQKRPNFDDFKFS